MTSDQETRVLAMLAAFEAGKKISDLDTASGSVSDMRIEVLDTDGESKVMNLSEAVTTAANAVCGRYWNESNSTYRLPVITAASICSAGCQSCWDLVVTSFRMTVPAQAGSHEPLPFRGRYTGEAGRHDGTVYVVLEYWFLFCRVESG